MSHLAVVSSSYSSPGSVLTEYQGITLCDETAGKVASLKELPGNPGWYMLMLENNEERGSFPIVGYYFSAASTEWILVQDFVLDFFHIHVPIPGDVEITEQKRKTPGQKSFVQTRYRVDTWEELGAFIPDKDSSKALLAYKVKETASYTYPLTQRPVEVLDATKE